MSFLISIIVPSLNQKDYITECLESIIHQKGASFELILIDGGSGEAVQKILHAYKDHFTTFVSEPDSGQAEAINKGLAAAKGELIGWLNTDDCYEPGALAAVLEVYEKDPKRPFYMGNGFRIDDHGMGKKLFYPDSFRFSRECLLWGENFILQPAAFINRKALEKIGNQLDPNLHYALDTDLWLRLSELGEPLYFDQPIANIREYEGSKTATGGWVRFEEVRRVAEKYTGSPLTPGALHVLMGTLYHNLENEEIASRLAPMALEKARSLWEQSGLSLKMLENGKESPWTGFLESVSGTPGRAPQIKQFIKVFSVLEKDRNDRGRQIGQLTEMLTAAEKDRRERGKQIQTLHGLLNASEKDRKARGEQVETLSTLLKKSEGDRKARGKQIETLSELLAQSEKDRSLRLKNNDALTGVIKQLEADLNGKDAALAKKDDDLRKKDEGLRGKDVLLQQRDELLHRKDREIKLLREPFWKKIHRRLTRRVYKSSG